MTLADRAQRVRGSTRTAVVRARVAPEVAQRLAAIAAAQGVTVSEIVRWLASAYAAGKLQIVAPDEDRTMNCETCVHWKRQTQNAGTCRQKTKVGAPDPITGAWQICELWQNAAGERPPGV